MPPLSVHSRLVAASHLRSQDLAERSGLLRLTAAQRGGDFRSRGVDEPASPVVHAEPATYRHCRIDWHAARWNSIRGSKANSDDLGHLLLRGRGVTTCVEIV